MGKQRHQFLTVEIATTGLAGGVVNRYEMEKELSRMDAEGWDLVTSIPTRSFFGYSSSVYLVFRRPLSE